jgi:Leucine-rich repeat (LRR) protein
MLNVTLKFSFYCVLFFIGGCSAPVKEPSELDIQHFKDSVSEARIDSAYAEIRSNCDTLMVFQVPKMVDSLLKDPALLQTFFNKNNLYSSTDKKAEKVIRQLQADCDSNLLKETYRRAQLRQKLKPKRHKKLKA